MNLLQAVGVLLQQGLPLPLLLKAIADFRGVPGRMERVLIPAADASQVPTVLVDYAHTPDGLENALTACRRVARSWWWGGGGCWWGCWLRGFYNRICFEDKEELGTVVHCQIDNSSIFYYVSISE